MRTGYLRQDDDGHWYAIPADLVKEFDHSLNEITSTIEDSDDWYVAVNTFSHIFSRYMTGGGYDHIEIILPE